MADNSLPALPPGFVLEDDAPPPPAGFVLIDEGRANPEDMSAKYFAEEQKKLLDSMSRSEKLLAGMGRSVAETWRGLKQVGGAVADAIPGVDASNFRQRTQDEINEARTFDAPLLGTGWGVAGNITGGILQLATPGAALKGTSAARAFLPSTIRGNLTQGAVLGALQPTATGESRAGNALIGGVAGGAGAAAVKAVAAGLKGAQTLLSKNGVSSIDKAAAESILREAEDASRLRTVAPSQVPGVQRSLAEETLDPGIARLERTVRSTGGQFDALDRANNAARVGALETFAKDDAALSSARRERNLMTEALREQAMRDRGVDVAEVQSLLEGQIKATATRPSVQSALQDVKRSLDNASDDVFSLYGTRKYIDDLLSGKAGGDKSYAKAATRELMQLKDALDKQMARASPSFEQYLQKYRELSVPINRMEVGRALTSRSSGSAILDPTTGAQVLTPAQFSKASRSLDDVAKKATGFSKAKASDILRPGDIQIIKAIQDDLERQAFRSTAGSGGNSQTFERLGVQDRLTNRAGRELLGRTPVVGQYMRGVLDVLDQTRNDQLKERLAYLVANPNEARRVIEALPKKGGEIVSKALAQASGAIAAATGVSAATQDQGLDIEITGGTPVSMDEWNRLRAAEGAY